MNLSPEEAQQLARFSVDHSGEATLWISAEGQVMYANKAAAHILRCDAQSLLNKTLFGLAPELDQDLWRGLWKEIRSQESFAFEFTFLSAEHAAIPVDIVVHRLVLGAREFATLAFQDIEERKRLKALEQGFVSTVSHELRTPLTVIREGVAQVIDGIRGDINDLQRRALSIALTGIDRLGRLIEELLDLSRMDSGKIRLPLERVDVAALVREVSASFQTMADERRLELKLNLPTMPCVTYAGRDRLIQVLTNLLDNAFKFTEQGRVELTVTDSPEGITCDVRDTGMGFPPEQAQRIFNRFEQLDTLSVTGEKGSGLGLSICKGIIELHKGRLWAESRGIKSGSRFVFQLPRRDARGAFREQLVPLIEETRQRGGNLSVVLFSLPIGSVPGTEPLLNALENLVQHERGRQSEILVKDQLALYTAFPSTVGKEAVRMADRIQAAFRDLLRRDNRPELELTYSVSSFPEQFPDPEAFLQHVAPKAA